MTKRDVSLAYDSGCSLPRKSKSKSLVFSSAFFMAHSVVIGRFGSGKSTFGTLLAIRELSQGTRPIVTTLALNLVEINEYLQEEYPDRDCRTHQRVLILNREQLGKFWRYRGIKCFGEYGPEPDEWGSVDNLEGRTADPRWSLVAQGVCYILDEAPARFHSRMWSQTGIEFSSYINQHRKLGDDVYSLARHSSMLDKQFRTTADRCVILDNWYQKSFGRFIKLTAPKRIKFYEYESCPPEKGETPFNQGSMYIDPKGLSRCFNTAGGLGISGVMGGADVGKVAKGLPWWTAIVACLLAIGGFAFLVNRAMGYALGKHVTGGLVQRVSQPDATGNLRTNYGISALQSLKGFGLPPAVTSKLSPAPAVAPAAAVAPVVCRGFAVSGGRYYLDTEEGLVEGSKLSRSNVFVYLDGVPYRQERKQSKNQESGVPLQR